MNTMRYVETSETNYTVTRRHISHTRQIHRWGNLENPYRLHSESRCGSPRQCRGIRFYNAI